MSNRPDKSDIGTSGYRVKMMNQSPQLKIKVLKLRIIRMYSM